MGAGVIPFCVNGGEVYFLFHKTFTGRRAGCLVDFGGGGKPGENPIQTAVREFIEETETMYFADDIKRAWRSDSRVASQMPVVEALVQKTLLQHPGWYCSRVPVNSGKARDWRTFFIAFEYRDLSGMNRQWRMNPGKRFKKRRELLWVPADELLEIYQRSPDKLWKRLRELHDVEKTIRSIRDQAVVVR